MRFQIRVNYFEGSRNILFAIDYDYEGTPQIGYRKWFGLFYQLDWWKKLRWYKYPRFGLKPFYYRTHNKFI